MIPLYSGSCNLIKTPACFAVKNKSIEIVIPNSDLIENANALFETIFKKLIKNTSQIQTLQTLRDTLLPKLISGEVSVRM